MNIADDLIDMQHQCEKVKYNTNSTKEDHATTGADMILHGDMSRKQESQEEVVRKHS
mgnify:CR=1 FL=1